MDLFPFENYTLQTNLSADTVKERLSYYVEPKKPFSLQYLFTANEKPYEGTIKDNSFRITRIIPYTNTFLPVIKGTIVPEHGGTNISINMRMMMGVLVLVSIWCFVAVVLATFSIIAMLQLQTFRTSIVLPIIMLLLAYFISTMSFKRESEISKEFFERIFESDITGL